MDAREDAVAAIAAAHDAYVHDAIGNADWERRGSLQRLVRRDRPALWRRLLAGLGRS